MNVSGIGSSSYAAQAALQLTSKTSASAEDQKEAAAGINDGDESGVGKNVNALA